MTTTTTKTEMDKVCTALDNLNETELKNVMHKYLYSRYNIKEKSLEYYYKNRDVILQKIKEKRSLRNEEDKMKAKQSRAEWYKRNKDKVKEKNKQYYEKMKAMKAMEKMSV